MERVLVVNDDPPVDGVVCVSTDGDAIWNLIYNGPFSRIVVGSGRNSVSRFLVRNADRGRWHLVPDEIVGEDEALVDLSRQERRAGAFKVHAISDEGPGWVSSLHCTRASAVEAARGLSTPFLRTCVKDAAGVLVWPVGDRQAE